MNENQKPEESLVLDVSDGETVVVDSNSPNAEEIKETLQRGGVRAVIGNLSGSRLSAAMALATLAIRGDAKVLNVMEGGGLGAFPIKNRLQGDIDLNLMLSPKADRYRPGFEKPHQHKGGHKVNARKSKKR